MNHNLKIIAFLTLLMLQNMTAQESANKFIHIEWESNDLASEYHLQISDSPNFFNVLFEKKTKESLIRLEPNPKYKFGRIAGIDKFGVRGEYSEVFEIEQRIIEKKTPQKVIPKKVVPLASNYLGINHSISLDIQDDMAKGRSTFYKLNNGKWYSYNGGVQLSTEGLNLIQYYSVDRLGNREKIKTMDYILDTESPFVEAIFINHYEDKGKFTYTGKSSQIEIKVSDLYSGIDTVKIYLKTIHESIEIEWDPKSPASIPEKFSGNFVELVVIATDRLGNTKKFSKFFKHDLEAPEVTIETKTKMDGTAKRISINRLSAYDLFSGVKHIFYSLNNSSENVYLEPIIISEAGEYELKVYAIDNVGNKSAIQYERIYISTPAKNKILSNEK